MVGLCWAPKEEPTIKPQKQGARLRDAHGSPLGESMGRTIGRGKETADSFM